MHPTGETRGHCLETPQIGRWVNSSVASITETLQLEGPEVVDCWCNQKERPLLVQPTGETPVGCTGNQQPSYTSGHCLETPQIELIEFEGIHRVLEAISK